MTMIWSAAQKHRHEIFPGWPLFGIAFCGANRTDWKLSLREVRVLKSTHISRPSLGPFESGLWRPRIRTIDSLDFDARARSPRSRSFPKYYGEILERRDRDTSPWLFSETQSMVQSFLETPKILHQTRASRSKRSSGDSIKVQLGLEATGSIRNSVEN